MDQLLHTIYSYIDLIWLPVAWFTVHRRQRLQTLAFVLICLLTMRTQVDLMRSIGFDTGILGLMDSSLLSRGMIIYSIIIMLFLLLAHYSPRTEKIIFFAAALSIYVFAFCLSMGLMVL